MRNLQNVPSFCMRRVSFFSVIIIIKSAYELEVSLCVYGFSRFSFPLLSNISKHTYVVALK